MEQAARPLGDWVLALPAARLYKADRRSRVWSAALPDGGTIVIKQFEHAPWRQRLAWWCGVHPAQRERRANRRLRAAGFPVEPIVADGFRGGAYLVTRHAGESLHNTLALGGLDEPRRRHAVARRVGDLAGRLIAGGWRVRDFKASNLLLDEADTLRLIDVASARRSGSRDAARRMLAVLDETATQAGASRADRLRALHAALDAAPGLAGISDVGLRISNRRKRARGPLSLSGRGLG